MIRSMSTSDGSRCRAARASVSSARTAASITMPSESARTPGAGARDEGALPCGRARSCSPSARGESTSMAMAAGAYRINRRGRADRPRRHRRRRSCAGAGCLAALVAGGAGGSRLARRNGRRRGRARRDARRRRGTGRAAIFAGGGRAALFAGGGRAALFAGGGRAAIFAGGGRAALFAGGGRAALFAGGGRAALFAGGGRAALFAGGRPQRPAVDCRAMDFGVGYFPTHDGLSPGAIARLVEERGHESLFFAEHTHIPASRESPWPGGERLPQKYFHTHDLFVALTAAAAATSRLRIGSGICLIVERDPIITAKEVASVDHLSGGRFEFG